MSTSFLGRTDLDLGLRNNNPGNIKDDGTAWLGKIGSDGTFVIFQDITWGVRAMAKAITTMVAKGASTIRLLINQWAPPSENSTDAYVAAVVNETGQGADDLLQLDPATLHDLIRAIIDHENGGQASLVMDTDIDTGVSMAQGGVQVYAQAASIAITGSPDNSTMIMIGAGLALALLLYVAYEGD
jgi:hypothetical protein